MFTSENSFQIMWKEIFFFWTVAFIVRIVIEIYLIYRYNYIIRRFYSNDFADLKILIKRIKNIYDLFSKQKLSKRTCLMYNNICCVLASIAFLENQDEVFFRELNLIKREEKYEMKSFMLALFYLSKKDKLRAQSYYENYLLCEFENENIKVVMEYFFNFEHYKKNNTSFEVACKSFKNPAVLKLLENAIGSTGQSAHGDNQGTVL